MYLKIKLSVLKIFSSLQILIILKYERDGWKSRIDKILQNKFQPEPTSPQNQNHIFQILFINSLRFFLKILSLLLVLFLHFKLSEQLRQMQIIFLDPTTRDTQKPPTEHNVLLSSQVGRFICCWEISFSKPIRVRSSKNRKKEDKRFLEIPLRKNVYLNRFLKR